MFYQSNLVSLAEFIVKILANATSKKMLCS